MLIDNAEQERIGWTKMLPPPPADSEVNSTLRHFFDTVWGGECNNHLRIRHVPRQRAGGQAAFDVVRPLTGSHSLFTAKELHTVYPRGTVKVGGF